MTEEHLDVCNAAVPFDQAVTLLEYVSQTAFEATFEDKAPTESDIIHSAAGNLISEWRTLEHAIDDIDSACIAVCGAALALDRAITLFHYVIDAVFRDFFAQKVAPTEEAVIRSATSNLICRWHPLRSAIEKLRAAGTKNSGTQHGVLQVQ